MLPDYQITFNNEVKTLYQRGFFSAKILRSSVDNQQLIESF
jgi:hypothetical protein